MADLVDYMQLSALDLFQGPGIRNPGRPSSFRRMPEFNGFEVF